MPAPIDPAGLAGAIGAVVVVEKDTIALLEVVRKHTRGTQRQLRSLASLYGQLADSLDELVSQIENDAQPKEAQRNDDRREDTPRT